MKKLIFLGFLLTGCSPDKNSEESYTEQPKTYYYEPAISVLTGKIEMENFWGPPGYGEDTLIDMKENCATLVLEMPIDVAADSSNEFNESAKEIGIIQLASTKDLNAYSGKRVTLKGKLFGAQTGHHHTPVLMDVTSIEAK